MIKQFDGHASKYPHFAFDVASDGFRDYQHLNIRIIEIIYLQKQHTP